MEAVAEKSYRNAKSLFHGELLLGRWLLLFVRFGFPLVRLFLYLLSCKYGLQVRPHVEAGRGRLRKLEGRVRVSGNWFASPVAEHLSYFCFLFRGNSQQAPFTKK